MPRPPRFRRRAERGAIAAAQSVRSTRGSIGRSLEHPADRFEEQRTGFDELAQRASFLASSPLFFFSCAGLVGVWAVGLAVGASSRFETAAAGLMSAVTLMLVALLKNAELRAERAVQKKLDAIASSLLEDRRGHQGDAEDQLERSIGVHEQI